MNQPIQLRYIGIDIAKDKMDLCVLPDKILWQEPNSGNFQELIQKLKAYSPTLVVMEPTGGYEKQY